MQQKRIYGILLLLFFGFYAKPVAAQMSGTVYLSGEEVEPSEVQTGASGYADVFLKGDTLSVEGSVNNLSSVYMAGGIYYGKKGEVGNLLFRLNPTFKENKQHFILERKKNKFKLTPTLKKALKEGALFISISSADYPSGEVRGQIKMIG